MSGPTRTLTISPALHARLTAPVKETGGYPDFVREIQNRLQGRELAFDDQFVDDLERLSYCYGTGFWQRLLRPLLAEIEAAGVRR